MSVTAGVGLKHAMLRKRALQRIFFSKNPRLLWKWVGGSRSLGIFSLKNHPKIALKQYIYFGVVYHVYSVCIYIAKSVW